MAASAVCCFGDLCGDGGDFANIVRKHRLLFSGLDWLPRRGSRVVDFRSAISSKDRLRIHGPTTRRRRGSTSSKSLKWWKAKCSADGNWLRPAPKHASDRAK